MLVTALIVISLTHTAFSTSTTHQFSRNRLLAISTICFFNSLNECECCYSYINMKGRYSQAISLAFIYGFKEVNNANEYNNAGHVADVFCIKFVFIFFSTGLFIVDTNNSE